MLGSFHRLSIACPTSGPIQCVSAWAHHEKMNKPMGKMIEPICTSTNRYSTAGLTPEETQLMMRQHILPLICQTAGQGFSRDALNSIRTQNVTHLLHRLRYTSQMTPDALTPYEVSLLRSSTILLARSQNPQASGGASVAGRAHVVHHAIHNIT